MLGQHYGEENYNELLTLVQIASVLSSVCSVKILQTEDIEEIFSHLREIVPSRVYLNNAKELLLKLKKEDL